ncbi:DUF885 family protein [Hyphococcus flavus]|uniref:DUF885 family protein n=1 Tax=Hyphococcus flavus TaxID=1866326 RepID=A0AAE9ZD98_9PROT|nr:DUF885 family protein [Hyphococcus flavus]WDI31460.1 DUF885 family protein [Hyphococcus flavus]
MNMSRRTLLQTTAATAAMSVLPACSKGGGDEETNLLDDVTDLLLNSYPETASSAGIDNGKYSALKSQLSDQSPEGQAAIESNVRDMLARLKKVDTSNMEAGEALNVDVIRTVFETAAEGFDFPNGDMALLNSNWSYRPSPYVVAQNTGAFVDIPSFLDSAHQIETSEDADAYLARMEAYAGQLDGESERITADGARGVILPDFLMAKTLGQLRTGRAAPVENWGIVTSLATRAADLGGDYSDQARAIAEDKIAPAMERQIAALEALEAQATDSAGVWAQPDGEAYYTWALKAATTTTMTPDEVHQMGLDELASLHAQMDPILKSIGYEDGPVGARMAALYDDPRYQFADGDEGRAQIMAFIDEKLEEIRGLMPQAFETLVPGFLEVTRISPDVEDGAPGAYGGAGSIDGTQPGHFWINLRTPDLHRTFTLQDLTYHEAIPGHVWQGEYTFKQPLVRSLLAFNAYSEGWALYAERIADELGVYDDFPVGRLGYLQSLAFRACRLVVDTGLHAKRWTRQQGIDFFVVNNGSNPDEVQSEVDRYCAWPGQACGYKVGHSAIVALREKAKAALGDKFDFRRFNDAVVLGGNVPMTVLERVIDDYIERERG